MIYEFKPQGVCSALFRVDIDDAGVIANLTIEGGCGGYARGMAQMVKGKKPGDVITALEGIGCGDAEDPTTSCPDQIAKMLTEISSAAK